MGVLSRYPSQAVDLASCLRERPLKFHYSTLKKLGVFSTLKFRFSHPYKVRGVQYFSTGWARPKIDQARFILL